jgi:hypothetical protein
MSKNTFLLSIVALLALASFGFYTTPAGTSDVCGFPMKAGGTCYHNFTTTGLDSSIADVSRCSTLSWQIDGDGTGDILMYAYRGDDSGGTVLTCDLDNDGDVDAADEAITFDGTAGKRGCRGVNVTKPKLKVDVQTGTGAGTAYVTVKCD